MIKKILRTLTIVTSASILIVLILLAFVSWRYRNIYKLGRYVDGISDVDQIDILYRHKPDWLKCSICPSDSCPGPCSSIHEMIISDPEEINRILTSFQNTHQFFPIWTTCRYTIKLVFHESSGDEKALLVCEERLFAIDTINASGTMSNSYFQKQYSDELRKIVD
ncbi:MAG: hypothetical protein KAU23_01195 [Anaerolineales bacterium]|nr:hypothetical protein [Anaerolineales bacterium]